MKSALMVLWITLCVLVVAVGYVRLAPSALADWHLRLDDDSGKPRNGGVLRTVPGNRDTLKRLDALIRATARTTVLAGSVEEGHITYITRSRVVGFPDYTTVQQVGDTLKLYARQRFGKSDFGVNDARVTHWLNALEAGR